MPEVVNILADAEQVVKLAETDPYAAAEILESWSVQLHEISQMLKAKPDFVEEGGFGDRVMVKAIGPNGTQYGSS